MVSHNLIIVIVIFFFNSNLYGKHIVYFCQIGIGVVIHVCLVGYDTEIDVFYLFAHRR